MAELLLLMLIGILLLTVYILYRTSDKRGLYFALVIFNITTFILSFKIIEILKMNINLGIVPYLGTLSILYIFIIKYGKKEIKELEKISLYVNILTAIFLVIMNYFVPALTETISINIKDTFIYNYKLMIAYPIFMFLSQYLSVKLYLFVNDIQNNKSICILLTYIITALLYTVIFYMISYINVLSIKHSIYIGISSYIIGLLITIIYLIFINYLTRSKKVIKWLILP